MTVATTTFRRTPPANQLKPWEALYEERLGEAVTLVERANKTPSRERMTLFGQAADLLHSTNVSDFSPPVRETHRNLWERLVVLSTGGPDRASPPPPSRLVIAPQPAAIAAEPKAIAAEPKAVATESKDVAAKPKVIAAEPKIVKTIRLERDPRPVFVQPAPEPEVVTAIEVAPEPVRTAHGPILRSRVRPGAVFKRR